MKNLDALYKQLVEADAKGDIQSAKQLQTEMKTLLFEDSTVAPTPPQQNATNVDALYEQLVDADAKGDVETAKQLQTQMRSLLFKEPEATEQPKTTQPPKEVPKIPVDVMGQKFTSDEYAKYSGMPIAAKPGEKAKGAFSGTFGQGMYNLAADAVISYGRTLGNPEEAEQIANRLREYAANTYTSANKSFREDPLTKIQELLGNSAPYMIGPVMAALGSTALGATGLVAGVAPTVVSATQFLGSNLQRQIEANNIDLADTNLLTAGATTIPQALLDNIGFRYIPGIKNIFGAAGKKISDETAKQIFNQSLLTSVGKKVLSSSVAATKGATVEGITETAQQVFERLQAGLSITNKEARDEYLESFFGGYIAGKAIGLPGALLSREPSAAAPTTEEPEPTTAEPKTERLSKQQQIKTILKDLEQEADQVNQAKVAAEAKLKSAQQKQVVSEAADLETTLPTETGVITPTTLTSWGIRKGSNAFKDLEGVDASTPEGRDLVDKTLEAYTGKLNEQAVNTFTSLLDKKAEAPDAGIDLGTTTISDAVLGGQKYGTPGGTQGRFGPTTDISGSPVGIDQTGTEAFNAPLETIKPVEPQAVVTEAAVEEAPVEEASVEEAPVEEPMPLQDEAKQVASELKALDRDNPLIENLLDETAVTEQDVSTAKEELATLKTARETKTPTTLAEEQQVAKVEQDLQSKKEGTPEGQAIVNTTKPANTLGQALNIIKKQHFNKLNPVEKILQNLFETLPNVLKGKYKVMGMPKGEYGKYTSTLNETIISPKAGTDTIYHEGTHAATVWAIRRHVTMDKNGRPKAKGNSIVGQQLVDIFDAAEVAAMQDEVTFGDAFKNMEEFVSYAFNDKDFQRFLAKQRSVAPTPAPKSSLWFDLMNAFNKLLGLDISDSLMSDIVALAPELMTGERPDNLKDFGQDKPLYNKDEEEKELNKLIAQTGQKRKDKTPKPTTFQRFKASPFKTLGEQITKFRKFAFDFEFAINKKILDAMRKSGVSMAELAKAAIELNIAQALYASETARAFLERGNISYDPKIFKFLVTESNTSMKKIKEAISDIAIKRNINVSTLFEAASTAFIAKRSRGLNESNQNAKARARALMLQGKTEAAKKELNKNFKLVHMSDAEIDAGFKILEKYPELNDVFDMWNDVRSKVLDFANTTGLLDKTTVERFLEVMDYVPFYRVFEDADGRVEVKGRKEYINGLLDASKEPKFEGSYREVNNVFDNMENWANYIIMKGIKNNAAAVKLRYYQEYLPDDIKKITGQKYTSNTNSIQIHENVDVNGEEKNILNRYEFQGYDAASMVDGFTGLEPVTIAGLKYFSNFSHFLRQSIVLYPIFSVKQVVMDTIAAITLSGVNYGILIPVQVLKEIALTPLGLSKARNRLKAVMAVGRADPSREFNRIDNVAADEAKKYKTYEAFKKAVLSPFSALAMASDNVIRQAIYAQTMLETGNEALAVHRAFEIINFKRTGSGQIFNIMRQLVPFTGASLQALHVSGATVFGEGITPDTRMQNIKRYVLNGAQIAIATLMYSILMSDDDEYKKLDPSERDSFFILPNGYKIPMRTDYSGLFFKVFTEHVYQRWVAESEDNKKMNKALLAGLVKATSIPSSMPVLIKPGIESYLNTNLYTNRPIVGQGQQSVEPEFQYSPKNTTQLALALGEASGTSPLIWDNVLKSVLGSTSQVLNMFTENMIADLRGETIPKKSFEEKLMMFPDVKSFVTQKLGARELNDLYELKDEVDKHYNTYKKLEKLAVDDKGQKEFDDYYTKNEESINVSRQLSSTDTLLAQLRTYENQVRTNSNMSPEDKRKEIDRIEMQRRELLNYPVKREDGSTTNYIQSLRERAGFNKEKVLGIFGGEE
jgi:hypothetical protein